MQIDRWDSKRFGGVGAPKLQKRTRPVRLIVLHMTAGSKLADSAQRVCRWFDDPTASGNVHYVCSNSQIVQYANDDRAAWGAGVVNNYAISIEGCGSADQTAAQFDDEYNRAMIANQARVVAMLAARHGIALDLLSDEQLRALHAGDHSISGVIGHVKVRDVLKHGTHFCPGPHYPYARLMAEARAYAGRIENA